MSFRFTAYAVATVQGRGKTFHFFDEIRDRLNGSRADLDAQSLEMLRSICGHAQRTTKAFAERFGAADLNGSQLASAGLLRRIPPVTKKQLRDGLDSFLSSAVDLSQCQKKSTSGSSGEPLVFYRDKDYPRLGEAATMRNMALAGWEPGNAIGYVWGYEKETGTAIGNLKSILSRAFYFNAFVQSPALMRKWIRVLRQHRVRFLYGYPSSLAQFARFITEQQEDLPMRAIFSTAEKYMPAERECIERAFQCKSYDLYGSSEVQNIGFDCTHGNMHVATDFVSVQEEPQPGGMPPLLVVTSYWNRCLPFIRYDLGDYGRIIDQPCPCGIQTPLMEVFGGSRYDFLQTRDGVVHGAVLERIFNKIAGVQRYQIVQHSLEQYTVRVEIAPGANVEELKSSLESTSRGVIERLFGPGARITHEYPDQIPVGRTGKFRFVLRETGG